MQTNNLTYVLANGDERSINLEGDKLMDFIRWFYDNGSSNVYELIEDIGRKITLFKDTILYVKY